MMTFMTLDYWDKPSPDPPLIAPESRTFQFFCVSTSASLKPISDIFLIQQEAAMQTILWRVYLVPY